MQATLDQRSINMGGEPTWIRAGLMVCEKTSSLNCHDWMNLMQAGGEYMLHGVFPAESDQMMALEGMLDASRGVLAAVSKADDDNRDELDKLKLMVAESLTKFELMAPRTELSILQHVIVHCADVVYKWNNVRNFWCFFGERSFVVHVHALYTLYILCAHFQ
jgi:hypothetical protein